MEEGPSPKHCLRLQLPVLSMSHLQSLSTQLLWMLRAGLVPPAAGANFNAVCVTETGISRRQYCQQVDLKNCQRFSVKCISLL